MGQLLPDHDPAMIDWNAPIPLPVDLATDWAGSTLADILHHLGCWIGVLVTGTKSLISYKAGLCRRWIAVWSISSPE
jgi:hypothetical protein